MPKPSSPSEQSVVARDKKIRKAFHEAFKAVGAKQDASWWEARLMKLYDSAKRANGGNSLTIYSDVADLLAYLDGTDTPPDGFDLFQACDNLASRLRRLGGDA